jgi:hypothetical protein
MDSSFQLIDFFRDDMKYDFPPPNPGRFPSEPMRAAPRRRKESSWPLDGSQPLNVCGAIPELVKLVFNFQNPYVQEPRSPQKTLYVLLRPSGVKHVQSISESSNYIINYIIVEFGLKLML